MQQGDGDPRPGAANRMPERDRSSVDVEFLAIEMEFAVTGDDLRGERFVEFDEVGGGGLYRVLFLQLLQSGYRTDAHAFRIDSGGSCAHNSGQRLQMVSGRESSAPEDDGCGSIGNSGCISRRHRSIGGKNRLELPHFVERGLGQRMLVAGKYLGTVPGFEGDRNDLRIKTPALNCALGPLLGAQRILILFFPGDLELARQNLRRLSHHHLGHGAEEPIPIHAID